MGFATFLQTLRDALAPENVAWRELVRENERYRAALEYVRDQTRPGIRRPQPPLDDIFLVASRALRSVEDERD